MRDERKLDDAVTEIQVNYSLSESLFGLVETMAHHRKRNWMATLAQPAHGVEQIECALQFAEFSVYSEDRMTHHGAGANGRRERRILGGSGKELSQIEDLAVRAKYGFWHAEIVLKKQSCLINAGTQELVCHYSAGDNARRLRKDAII